MKGINMAKYKLFLTFIALLFCLGMTAYSRASENGTQADGVVYVMTNRANGNSVLVFRRSTTGQLQKIQEILTGGLGTGVTLDPLMSQSSLALRDDGKVLLAVNAGSGDLTAFVTTANGLKFGSKVPSGGLFPVSVTVHGNVVYVLNQLGIPNVTGFTVSETGILRHIANSSRKLAGGGLAQPAQVSFAPDGSELLVTEKGTDLIDLIRVEAEGTPIESKATASAGHTPFGFAFGPNGTVVITEAERRLPKEASVSSYHLGAHELKAVSARVQNRQTAACWITVIGQIAFVVNTGTFTISSYQIGLDGTLNLLEPIAASTGSLTTPIDLAATADGSFIYVLKSAVGAIEIFRVDNSARLTRVGAQTGLPLSIQGIAAQ
jgi:6-phosphogluconolactonase (cycloisomerase 2 family)